MYSYVLYEFVRMGVSVWLHVSAYLHVCECKWGYLCKYACACMCAYVCVYVRVSMRLCVSI